MDARPLDPPGPPAPRPGVLWTKLHTPRAPAPLVVRRRLLDRLDDGIRGGVTLVCAPAGFGKSTLLAEACDRRRDNAVWLSLDGGDNDPIRFWRHVAAGLDRAGGGLSGLLERVERTLRAGDDRLGGAVPDTILDGLASARDRVVLVLDDYHVVENEAVHESVAYLLEHAPVALRVIIASRADPPLPLATWRAAGTLVEVRAADLRFTTDEASSLLRNVTGSEIDESIAAVLADRTEGWAAGLQLAGLSMASRDDAETFARGFSGSHRFVLDYLTEEVLDRQPPDLRDFLLRTSVLDRLSGPLCDAVTGRTDSQAVLEAIERANLFLEPLDDVREWWRYHHLFADLLRSRYRQQERADAVGETHRRAAHWCAEHGEVDDAIGHALAAGDATWAAELIERHADELLLRREGATLRRWFSELPRGALDSRRLLLAQARIAVYGGRVNEADQLLDQADRAAVDPTAPFEPSVDATASPLASPDPTARLLRAFTAHMRGHADEAESLARTTLDECEPGSVLGLIARWHLATAPWLRGDAREAEAALAENIDGWRAVGDHDRAAWSAHYLGQIQQELGDPEAALATYEAVLALDTEHTGDQAPAAGAAHVGIAQVAYGRGNLETAEHHARLGIERCRAFVYTQALATGLTTLARIHQARGDTGEAGAMLAEAARLGIDRDVVDLLNPVPSHQAGLLLAGGDAAAALRWAERHAVGADLPPSHRSEPAHLALARILVANGRPDEALDRLDPLAARALAEHRLGRLVEIEVLRALARDAAGDRPGARRAAADAVAAAVPQGAVQVFIDAGDAMAGLLATIAATADAADAAFIEEVGRTHRAVPAGHTTESSTEPRPLAVPLTDRELEVLTELATGKPNKQIAADLYVSLNTVKKHVTHIFDKLGVANRTEAVACARHLGLIR